MFNDFYKYYEKLHSKDYFTEMKEILTRMISMSPLEPKENYAKSFLIIFCNDIKRYCEGKGKSIPNNEILVDEFTTKMIRFFQ